MPERITDVWFVTELSLRELASLLRLDEPSYDGENYWSWVIGYYHGCQIDITRTHRLAPTETPTRIFMADCHGPFPYRVIESLLVDLLWSKIRPVHLGEWQYLRGNEFDMKTHRTID